MPPRLPAPFGVSWDLLDLPAMRAFLAQGEDESLTWEAKGGDITPHHVREAASAFGNSVFGGFLIFGATQNRASGEWTIDGWRPPEPEVDLWVQNCLDGGGVLPKPSVEVRPWPLDEGGTLAVAAIWPVAVPPVITRAGQVWERTSSKSVKVTDPADLRRLFERGEAARSRAYQRSYDGAGELFAIEQRFGQPGCILGFAATSLPSEMAADVFRQSRLRWFADEVKGLHRTHIAANLQEFVNYEADWNQGGITFRTGDGFAESESYSLRVGRDGRVALAFRDPDIEPTAHPENYLERLRAMWGTGKTILNGLGALGEIHAVLKVNAATGGFDAASWSDMASDGRDELEAMVRDIQRGLGNVGWEPEQPGG